MRYYITRVRPFERTISRAHRGVQGRLVYETSNPQMVQRKGKRMGNFSGFGVTGSAPAARMYALKLCCAFEPYLPAGQLQFPAPLAREKGLLP